MSTIILSLQESLMAEAQMCRKAFWNVDRLRLFLIAAHNCRGHGEEKDGHADDRTNDSCDSFHNAVSLPRWDSGAAQNVID